MVGLAGHELTLRTGEFKTYYGTQKVFRFPNSVFKGLCQTFWGIQCSAPACMYNTVATRDINFGILIKIPQKVELDLPQILRQTSKKNLEFIFLCLVLPSKMAQKDDLEGKTRQRKMNSKIVFDGRRDIQGKSSSTFWGIFINIPKLISRVATVIYMHTYF